MFTRFTLLTFLLSAWVLAETPIRVQGLPAEDTEKALDALSGRLTFVRARPPAPSRADDAAFLLERYLELDGYKAVDVDWRVPGDGSILLLVDTGIRYTLGEISIFDGDPPAPEEHKDYFLQPFVKRDTLVQDEYPYLEEDVEKGGENLRNYLRSLGYWDSWVDVEEPRFRPRDGKVDIIIRERRQRKYVLGPPILNVSGGAIPDELSERLDGLIGQDATSENINAMRSRVDDSFSKLGYPYLELTMQQDNRASGQTVLTFNIATGNRFRVGDVSVTGNKLTRSERITDRFSDLQGEEFEREEAQDIVKKLLGTGAFTGITLDELPRPTGEVDFLLRVQEAKPYGASAHAGAGSLEGFIFGLGFYNRNLFGELYNLNVGAEISGLGLLGEVSLTNPFIFGRNDLAYTIRAYALTRRFDSYQKFQTGIENRVDWQVNDFYSIGLGAEFSFNELESEGGLSTEEIGIDSYSIGELALIQKYDRLDVPTGPENGYKLELETRLGLAIGEDAVSYLANQFTGSYFKTFAEKNQIALGVRLGNIIPQGDRDLLPIDLRYFNGGANSVRSFKERDLGPRSGRNTPIGGRSYFIANAEYIRTITSIFKGVVFIDAGGLSPDSATFGLDDPRYAVGAGVRLDLPIGPVRFEYGYNLNRGEDEDPGAFHFAIGAAF